MTPHNEAKKGQIAKKVIMPGDPLRAKFIAENYLENVEIVSKVRGNNIYTGYYKKEKITIMASGMGIPSIGIYAEELYKFDDVDTIIRVGTAGSYKKDLNLFDVIVAKSSYSESAFTLTNGNKDLKITYPSKELNDKIEKTAKELDIQIHIEDITSTDSFYMDDVNKFFQRMPENFKPAAAEMESYALFYLARKYNKQAACILTISDIIGTNVETSPEEREKGLRKSIELALEVLK